MQYTHIQKFLLKKIPLLLISVFLVASYVSLAPQTANPLLQEASAACTTAALPTSFGVVTQTVNVATAGTYRVWSRIKAPNTTANSYYFEVDGGCAYNVGDSTSVPASTWTWVNYQDGTSTAPIDVTLTAGSHTLTYTGKEADVQLDKIMLLGDMACVPTGLGDNCAVTDTIAPTVSITAPADGSSSTVGSSITMSANATDAVGVTKVEFYQNGSLVGTDTTTPYSLAWNTTGATAGVKPLTAKAYDAAGNVATSAAVSVTLTTASTVLPGDVNGDSRVNALDLSSLISHDGQNYPPADFNGDSTVGAADMAILLSKWTW